VACFDFYQNLTAFPAPVFPRSCDPLGNCQVDGILEEQKMTNAIELLRTTADKCERRAKDTRDRVIKAELFDMTAQWHWLAGEAAKLNDRAKELQAV